MRLGSICFRVKKQSQEARFLGAGSERDDLFFLALASYCLASAFLALDSA
jgi:hypothetical protein